MPKKATRIVNINNDVSVNYKCVFVHNVLAQVMIVKQHKKGLEPLLAFANEVVEGKFTICK